MYSLFSIKKKDEGIFQMCIDNPTFFKRRNYAKNLRIDTRASFQRQNYVKKCASLEQR